ncbi:hypothetical protein TcWFU_003955 [Taenia crassiceps]|uniref:Uncharacterized protein n=1 Tax=Taenia crassiceps TaxID=6207 RepID=A0ABR4QKU6_9CEST
MTEKAVAPVPCLRSHDLSRFQPPSKDQVPADEEILRLVQQMPTFLYPYEGSGKEEAGEEVAAAAMVTERVACKSSFRLVVPPDVDPVSAAPLDPSWFVNIVVTITDRNGCVIYHEAHFPKNPSLRDGIKNFVDIRWGDFVHPPDADIWGQHLLEAFAEADRWRAARLAASQSPPPPTANENGGGSGSSGSGEQQRRRRVSSGGGASQPQQQVVSTTSRLSPDIADSATEEALLRRFVLSPLYRARWGGLNNVFYFRTVSLPFLRNQGGGDGSLDDKAIASITNETTNVFSPTSSFENLLLLSYHCILGKAPDDALSEAVGTGETTVFDAVTLRVAQKPTDLAPFKSTVTPTAFPVSTTTSTTTSSASPMEHLTRVFCFDNLLDRSDSGSDAKFWSVSQSGELCHHHYNSCYRQQGDRSTDTYRFTEPAKTHQTSPSAGTRPASHSSAHLAPVDIDWIDQSQPLGHQHQQRQQQHYSGMPRQKESAMPTEDFHQRPQQQRFGGPTSTSETPQSSSPIRPSELNKATSQHDRISIFLSLLLPEAIREIKEAVSAEPDMVAQRVRAIVTRHLGPEILSKFFSSPQQPSTTSIDAGTAAPPPSSLPPTPQIPTPSTSSSMVTLSPVATARQAATVSTESGCCGSIYIDGNARVASTPAASSQPSVAPLLLKESPTGLLPPQQSKRPSLVQELSVTSDVDPLPPPVFYNSTSGKKDFSPRCSVSYGSKPRAAAAAPTPSAQTSGTTTPASFDSMAGSSPWMVATRGSQQPAPSLLPPSQSLSLPAQQTSSSRNHTTLSSSSSSSSSISSQEVHSTAGVLESLLMGGYVAPDSRLRRVSGSSVATATTTTTTVAIAARHRNASEATSMTTGGGISECRQVLSSSGPSSTCCQALKVGSCFSFNGEEWPMVVSTASGSSSNSSPTTGTRTETLNSTSQLIMSPNSSSSCSSLAHLLRHGCPPASVGSTNSAITTAVALAPTTTTVTTAGASDPMSSPTLPTACSVRASRLAATAAASGIPKIAPTRPLDCPLSIIVDPQPPSGVKSATHRPLDYEDGLSPKMQGPHPSKLPPLAPQPKDYLFPLHEAANSSGICNLKHQSNASGSGGSSGGGMTRKANIRDTSEDEDAALANSSLCRLLQGPDPRWETVTAEVDATAQEDAPIAPPPPPPSFFELPSDVLVVSSGGSGGEVRRARYDSCPMALRQPLSVPTPSQVSVAPAPPSQLVAPSATAPVMAKGSVGGLVVVGSNANGGSCCRGSSSSAPPSAVNAMDVSNSSPVTLKRNRRAAAAAAAQIAEEAEHQRRQRPSSRHLLERQRLLFQQNVGQVTTYGSGSHSLLEGTLSHHHHQQQTLSNCGFSNSGSGVPSSSSTAACRHIQPVGGEGFCELDAALLAPNPTAPASQTQSLVNQRTPLEDFSRRMKEIAPNVRVSPTGYHHHFSVPSLYPPDRQQQHHQQQQRMSQAQPTYEYSGGHLAPVNYEYQDHQQTTSSPQGLLTGTSSQYENPALGPQPSYTSHLPPIQPKLLSHHQHHNLQHHPSPHHPHQYQHQQQQLQRQNQQPYYHTQSHPQNQQQQQLLFHQQRPSLPQPSSPQSLRGSEAYATSPNMGYFDPQFSCQRQHQMLMQQQPPPQPPNYLSPLSMALQQNQPLPHSQVKASLRVKVTSRCQARDMDVMATGSTPPPPPPLPVSTIPPYSAGSVAPTVIGQKRPHPPDSLKGGVGSGRDEYFYGPPPPHPPSPHYRQTFGQVGSEVDLPLIDDSTYEGYDLPQQQAPLPTESPSPSQQRFTERHPSMLFEAQQYAPVCNSKSVDNTSAITAVNSNTDSSNKVNEDIQLTADIVNDVLELEALL